MTAQERLGAVVARIGNATGAIRVRTADVSRVEHNGGSTAALRARIEVLVTQLERVADDLEDALA